MFSSWFANGSHLLLRGSSLDLCDAVSMRVS